MDKDGQQSPSFAPESEPERSGSMPVMRITGTPFTPGEVIGGRYRVERIVAEGGMGIIVAAHHLELEERVAIKFLKEEFASKPEIVGRFAREAKAAARIKCEYTPTVFDVGISRERGPYIVMEYLEGEDLELVLDTTGRLPFARATELIMQAGEALAVAHANGIIHRDIKPANLFLVRGDQAMPVVKVLDFGVSKTALTGVVFGGAISLVKTQSLVGSPIYMPPEQIRGKEDVSYTGDVWSLGAVLYELVTGVTAFTGSSITELCASVLESEPPPVGEHVPDIPAGLAETIMRCLEKNPKRRFQSVAELVVALAPYAPKRARMTVDRAIAVSKSAGLVPASFSAPTTLAPPPLSSDTPVAIPPMAAPPRLLIDTQPEVGRASSRRPLALVDDGELPAGQKKKRRNGTIIGLLLIAAGGIMGAVYFARRPPEQPAQPAAATATDTAPPAAAAAPAASPTESVTFTPPQATPQNSATATAATTKAGGVPPSAHGTARAGAVPRAPAATLSTTKLAAPPGQAAAAADAQPPKKTDTVKSAIDDRK